MKASECKSGVTVALNSTELPIKWGKVIALHLPATKMAIVEWDSGEIGKHTIMGLLNEKDGKELEVRLITEQSNLEIEFLNSAEEIRYNLEEATSLLERASSLLNEKGMFKKFRDGDVDFYELTKLRGVVQDLPGWSSSSWSC